MKEDLKNLTNLDSSIVFFISPKKINKAIPHLKNFFLERKFLICREMTKYYEEYIRGEINDLKKFDYELKGELTIVISGKEFIKKISPKLSESDKMIINKMINKLSVKEIISLINQNNKIPKKQIYDYCLKLKNDK